jgi:hypothetical protein
MFDPKGMFLCMFLKNKCMMTEKYFQFYKLSSPSEHYHPNHSPKPTHSHLRRVGQQTKAQSVGAALRNALREIKLLW